MPTKNTQPSIQLEYLILILIGVLFALLYYFSFAKPNSQLFQPVAAQVDFKNATGEYNPLEQTGQYLSSLVQVPTATQESFNDVLGLSTEPKHIEIDLTNQRLYAMEGDKRVYDFLISSGKWGRTPTGRFRIWTKLRYTKMSGGSKEKNTYYYLPNVPFTMFFYNEKVPKTRGFGIHGTYWHDNFGQPMSHGCINMKTAEAELLYNWANPVIPAGKTSIGATQENPGTEVIIYGTAPNQ